MSNEAFDFDALMKRAKEEWGAYDLVIKTRLNAYIWGPPGIGKTYQMVRTASAYSISVTEEMGWAELVGRYVPRGQFTWEWQDGPALQAARGGKPLVVNEVHRACGDLLSGLLALMDSPESRRLTLLTSEVVVPQEGFQVVCTANTPPDGLDFALLDRMPVRINITLPHPNLCNVIGKGPWVSVAEGKTTVRQWLAFRQALDSIDKEDAAFLIFGDKGAEIALALC